MGITQVLKLSGKSERVVKAGDFLMEIGNVKQLEVEVEVLSSIAVKLKSVMKVKLHQWGGEKFLHGTIKIIEPSGFTKISALGVEEQRVNVIVSVYLEDNSEKNLSADLGDGFRIEAHFILCQADKILQIPNSALFIDKLTESKKEWAVYVINNGKLEKRPVKIGHRNHIMAEVLEGLTENESLVSFLLSNDLNEGLKVDIR